MRLLGLPLLMLCGYYVRFYLARGDPVTLVQIATLLAASTLVLFSPVSRIRWRLVAWRDWLVLATGVLVAVGFVVAMDRDSHSATDTLNRVAPSLSLWLALGLRLRAERAA
jgi:hypothetical protein